MHEAEPPFDSPPGSSASTGESPSSARNVAILCHLGGFAGYVVPFGGIAVPVVVWLLKRDDHPYIDDQGKEAINFQISVALYAIASVILVLLLVGILFVVAVALFHVVMMVVAAVRVSGGERFRYPLTIRLLT